DLLGLFGRHGAVLIADVGELAQRNLERDRHAVETIDGNRLLAALDLADEFPAEPGPLAETFLAERALFAQGAQTLTEKFPDVFDGELEIVAVPGTDDRVALEPAFRERSVLMRAGRTGRVEAAAAGVEDGDRRSTALDQRTLADADLVDLRDLGVGHQRRSRSALSM